MDRSSYINHVLELLLRGVVAQGPHDGAQLLGGHRPVPVLVEHHEGLLEALQLLVGDLDGVLVSCSYNESILQGRYSLIQNLVEISF